MTNSNIRKASRDDLSKLLELEQKIVDSERPYYSFIKENNVTYYDLQSLISDDDSYLIVIESGTEIIGSGYAQMRTSRSCFTHNSHCYLGFIYLEPDYRGKSIGSRILNTLKEWGMKKGTKHFQLDVYSKNESAIRAYKKAGFNEVSVKMELTI